MDDVRSISALDVVERSGVVPRRSSRTLIIVVGSSRTDLHDDVVDVPSLSALDVVENGIIVVVVVVGARRS